MEKLRNAPEPAHSQRFAPLWFVELDEHVDHFSAKFPFSGAYEDAMCAAKLHAQFGGQFGERQALLRAGSARLLPGEGDEDGSIAGGTPAAQAIRREQEFSSLPEILGIRLFARGEFAKAKQLHEDALAISRPIGQETRRACYR